MMIACSMDLIEAKLFGEMAGDFMTSGEFSETAPNWWPDRWMLSRDTRSLCNEVLVEGWLWWSGWIEVNCTPSVGTELGLKQALVTDFCHPPMIPRTVARNFLHVIGHGYTSSRKVANNRHALYRGLPLYTDVTGVASEETPASRTSPRSVCSCPLFQSMRRYTEVNSCNFIC